MSFLQKRRKKKEYPDLSFHLKQEDCWSLECHQRLHVGDVTAIDYSPELQIYAIGLSSGQIHIYGSLPVHFAFTLPAPGSIKHIQVSAAAKRLVCIDNNHQLVVWSLEGTLSNQIVSVTAIPKETIFTTASPFHDHVLVPHPDGSIQLYDLSRFCFSPTSVPVEQDSSAQVVMDLTQSRNNLDFLVIARDKSIQLWQFSSKQVVRQYMVPEEAEFLPVCLTFHPSEDVFVAGLADGRLCFWGIDDPTPLWVTTISELADEKKDEDTDVTLLPIFKIEWTPSVGCSNMTILGGCPAGKTTLRTLTISNTPLHSVDQLIPTSTRAYDELSVLDIRDFAVLTESGQVLVLDSDNCVTCVSLTNKPSRKSTPYLPFLLRPPLVSSEVTFASTHVSKTLLESEKPLSALAKGGISRPVIHTDGPDPRLSKYDAARLVFGIYSDNVIRFDDLSSRLLVAEDPLELPYPNPLPHLSIDVQIVLEEPLVWASMTDAADSKIQSIGFVPESLECYVFFATGELMVWRVTHGQGGQPLPSSDTQLVDLTPISTNEGRFSPYFLFNCKEGAASAFSTCEVGFTAVSYSTGSVYIIDIRGPRVLLHHKSPGTSATDATITLLRFAICSIDGSGKELLRLVAFRRSGAVTIFTLISSTTGWSVEGNPIEIAPANGLAQVHTSFFIDVLSGNDLEASKGKLAEIMAPEQPQEIISKKLKHDKHFYRVSVSKTAVRCDSCFDGERIKSADVANIRKAALVQHKESTALLLFGETELTILALPHLQHLKTVTIRSEDDLDGDIRVLASTGDFLVTKPSISSLWSITGKPKTESPQISFSRVSTRQSQQGPGLVSWLLGAKAGMTGEEFDSLVAGPNRPPPPQAKQDPFNKMKDAAMERGERIENLAKQTEELENAAHNMAEEAQRIATMQSKRKWYQI